jgi:hypothetical protein
MFIILEMIVTMIILCCFLLIEHGLDEYRILVKTLVLIALFLTTVSRGACFPKR